MQKVAIVSPLVMTDHQNKNERLILPRTRILRGIGVFGNIFKNGMYLNGNQVDARFLVSTNQPFGCFVGFVASKRNGNAVVRNHQKRLMREAFRINGRKLQTLTIDLNTRIELVLVAKRGEITFSNVQSDVIKHIDKIAQKIIM